MSEQIGWRSVLKRIKAEAPHWGAVLPTLPRKIDAFLTQDLEKNQQLKNQLAELQDKHQQQKRLIMMLTAMVLSLLAISVWVLI
jgi:ubiquinone biosynthesis protein